MSSPVSTRALGECNAITNRGIRRSELTFCTRLGRHFLQTPPRGDALALRYPSPPSGWDGTCTRKLSNMHGVHRTAPPELAGLFRCPWGRVLLLHPVSSPSRP